jgi:predicted alpha-1,2-mannosidase
MRGKTVDGDFAEPFDPRRSDHREGTDYTEGNAWQHSWFVPHDVAGLIEAMSGEKPFLAKLDSLFTLDTIITGENVSSDISGLIGQYAHGNEPSHHIAYLYNYAGKPWKTQKRLRKLLDEWFRDDLMGVPGDEDGGGMSAFVVFSQLGFYPVTPGKPEYSIGSPVFEQVEFTLASGKTLVIEARNASFENKYIQSVQLNGEELTRHWFLHNDIIEGGELVFEMGPKANRTWGTSD